MEWLTLALMVVRGVSLMESLFSDFSGSGAIKKSTLTNAIKDTVAMVGGVSTGGQKETWETIAGSVDALIEGTVTVLNTGSKIAIGKDFICDDKAEINNNLVVPG